MMLLVVEWNYVYSLPREMFMEIYMVYLFYFYSICIALAYGVMSQMYDSDCTGTISFIEHNDAASHLVGYESRRHGIAIAIAFAL